MSWKGDPNAIHLVVDGEIDGLTEKATPVDADLVIIEDSADSNSKKKAQLGNLPGGGGTDDHGALTGLTDDDHTQYLLADGTRQADYVDVSGLTGATSASRYVGATTSGAPASGTFAVGDFVITQDGSVYVCTTAGSPGTWTEVGAAAATDSDAIHDNVAGEISAITEKASPASGDWLLIEDAADSNNKKKVDWDSLPSGGGGGGTVPEWVEYLAVRQADETSHADDDFFDDGTKTGWSEHTVAGTATWTESRDRMNVKAVGGAGGDAAVNMQSIGATGPPYTIEAAIVGQSWGVDFFQTGICFTDGLTDASNVVWLGALARGSGSNLFTLGRGTLTSIANTTSDTGAVAANGMHQMWQYFRLVNTAANTWAANVSPNGVDWWDLGFAPVSFTMTPTHYGLFVAQYNSASTPLIASWEYFRVYESDLDV